MNAHRTHLLTRAYHTGSESVTHLLHAFCTEFDFSYFCSSVIIRKSLGVTPLTHEEKKQQQPAIVSKSSIGRNQTT